jgi:hypothetical protein
MRKYIISCILHTLFYVLSFVFSLIGKYMAIWSYPLTEVLQGKKGQSCETQVEPSLLQTSSELLL